MADSTNDRASDTFKCPSCSEWQTEGVQVPSSEEGQPWTPPVCTQCVKGFPLTEDDIREMWATDRKWDFDYDLMKHRLYGEQEGHCNGCDTLFEFRHLTLDHIEPKSEWYGSHQWLNLQLLCNHCNSLKSNGTMEDLRRRLEAKRNEGRPQPFRLARPRRSGG